MMPQYEKDTIRDMKLARPELANVPEWILYELYATYSAVNYAGWLDWSAEHFNKWADERAKLYAEDT